MRVVGRTLALTALLALPFALVAGCSPQKAERLGVVVLEERPHDRTAFTQGLLLHGDLLYESTGLVGASSLREVDPVTGEVLRIRHVPAPYFGEGLALVGEELLQLTWQEGVLFRYDRASFEPLAEVRYAGEGWGLCYDGEKLFMTDGSATLFERDPKTFAITRQVEVKLDGEPLRSLNELECVNGKVYANVFTTDDIVRIDPGTGRVEALIDASPLRGRLEDARGIDVLNGIAFDAGAEAFLVTGKLWPTLFVVRFE